MKTIVVALLLMVIGIIEIIELIIVNPGGILTDTTSDEFLDFYIKFYKK